MWRLGPGRRVRAGVIALSLLATGAAAGAADRPKVGLVLGGGGARGAAHVGVLEVLERLRVPVDCVSGTSMGALVAGVWASGMAPAQMRAELARADWNDMFQDNPGYEDQNYRGKRLAQRFLPGSETGLTALGAVAPPGLVSGQKIKLFFNQMVQTEAGERRIDQLALPVSIIATDIATGERVVYRDGSLTQAMRASMSVPGLMAPLEYRGRKLVDGGLVDNLPVREVRERCGAEVVIAVNVGSPLLAAKDITGLLSVSAQMVAILTEQNVTQSLAQLRPGDLLIKPELGDLSAADFGRNAEAADLGRAAAERLAPALQALAVDEARYAAWRERATRRSPEPLRIDEIQTRELRTAQSEGVRRHVQQKVGEALDLPALNRDLLRAFSDGHYQAVDYTLSRVNGRNVLRILPVEKSWGPDYLRFGFNLDSSLRSGSTFGLRAAYHKTWLNRLGGEALLSAELGSNTGVGAEWYQPLESSQRWFVEALGSTRREAFGLFRNDLRVAEYRNTRSRADVVAGLNLALLGQLRLGWREERLSLSLDTGAPLLSEQALRTSGWLAALELDQLDRLYWPTSGWRLRLSWFESARESYSRVGMEWNSAHRLGAWVLGLRALHQGAGHGALPQQDAAALGGFLNLSGFASGQLRGDQVSYGHVRAERIVGHMPLGLRGDMRLGLALEAGKVGKPLSEPQRTGWLNSGLLYLGAETGLGPLYLGLGHSSSGTTNAYLFLGLP